MSQPYGSQGSPYEYGASSSPAVTAGPPAPDVRPPGIASAAAVLGFVEAGLALAFVVYALAQTAAFGAGDDTALAALVLVTTLALSALLLLGSLFLVRGQGRKLLIGATIAEIVIVLGLGIWALAEVSTSYDPYGFSSGLSGTVVAFLVVGLVLPVVRLVLTTQRPVGSWLDTAAGTRQAVPPVWSPETNAWVAGPGASSTPGPVIALMAPVAALALATVVVLATAGEPQVDYATDFGSDFGGGSGSSSDWSYLYDGGDPVEPPTSSDPEYDPTYDADAQDCYDGDLSACDDLYFETPVGSLYEWLGETCGGRQEEETPGSCD